MPSHKNNPVQKIVEGVKIRKYNYVNIMYGEQAFEEIILEAAATGLSIPDLMAIKSKPCQNCGCDNITITIKKNGRSNKQKTSHNIISQNAKGHPDTSVNT